MKICVFTSGGDAPGMNAAIRAVVRTAVAGGHQVFGALEGYRGVIQNHFVDLDLRSVANIIHRGGTLLKTSRCPEFTSLEGREAAYQNLKARGIDVLIGLGGDGTIKGLEVFNREHPDVSVLGIPCTIDNDYGPSENCIGFHTAAQTAVEAIDKIRDTASSHQRTFIIEVMGRKDLDLAYFVALAAGAEAVVNPSEPSTLETCIKRVEASIQKGKKSSLIVTLEAVKSEVSAALQVKQEVERRLKIDCRTAVLGHVQRGGAPVAADRVLASEMAFVGIKNLDAGSGVVVQESGRVVFKKFGELNQLEGNTEKRIQILETLAH